MRAGVLWRAVCALLYCAGTAQAARVLAVLPTNTKSHYAMYGRLLEALALRQHELTVISHFNMKHPHPNVEEISIAGTIPEIANNLTTPRTSKPEFITNLEQIMDECVQACEELYKVENVKSLLNSTVGFDLIIVEVFGTECVLPFAHRFGAPVVGLLSSVPLPWVNSQLGMPDGTAYIPAYMMSFGQNMNVWERFFNTISVLWAKTAYRYRSQIPSQAITDKVFGPTPPLEELAKNYSLILSNSHFSINDVRPLVPSMIEVGGLHLDNSQQLPKDLKQVLDSSTEGVIYWSFGSISRIETIPTKTLIEIFEVFSQLQQTVIIKMDRNLLSSNITIPDNVITRMWMPQYKTLCHPNVKVFISHGGLLGTQESIACGVPMLVVPLYADQHLNARAMEDRGVARVLQFKSINSQNWKDSITELINNKEYKSNALRVSSIFLDRPTSPLDTGVYWVEYVLRHKGARHLRSPALDLSLHQYLLLDVLAISIIITLAVLCSIYLLLHYVYVLAVMWWPLDKLTFDENLFKKGSLLFMMFQNTVCKVKTN